jgi:hypothetical protein
MSYNKNGNLPQMYGMGGEVLNGWDESASGYILDN